MRRGGLRVTALVMVCALAFAGCGDDDEEEGAPAGGGGATTTTTTALSAQAEAFCADVVKANTLEPDIPEDLPEAEQMKRGQEFFQTEYLPVIKRIQATAPPETKGPVDEIARFFEEKGPQAFEDDAFSGIALRANQAAATACRAEENSVTAVDYAFEGIPSTLESGRRLFRFRNTGTELHEMIVLRKKPATTETFDQILALGAEDQAAAEAKVDEAGALFAFPAGGGPPAADASAFLELTPGQYAVVCFIPVGLTPQAAQAAEESQKEPEGPPHFTRGMKVEFTVA